MVVLTSDVVVLVEPAFVKVMLLLYVLVEIDSVVLVGVIDVVAVEVGSGDVVVADVAELEVGTIDVALEMEVTGRGFVRVDCVVVWDVTAVVVVIDKLGGAAGNSREK